MSDYIERQDAVDAVPEELKVDFMDEFGAGFNSCRNEMLRTVKDLPSADVVQVVHGRWENYSPITIKCSHCGHVIHDWRYSECKYCPNCGAKMDGERKE